MNFLLSSFCENGFYEDAAEQVRRFLDLTDKVIEEYGAPFASRAAIFARDEMGMRSISQLLAARLNSESFENKRLFYATYFTRPDDVAEVFAILDSFGNKRSHALVRGAADYLKTLNGYKLDKYAMRNKDWSMVDIINVTHAYTDNIDAFYNGYAPKANTWEQLVSAASSKEERDSVWRMLVETEQLGYMALIRNLNNILDSGIDERFVCYHLVPQIENGEAIRRSKVFPYQIYTAYTNLNIMNTHVVAALEKAFRISVENMPAMSGSTCIALDVSGSMDEYISAKSRITIKEVGAVYAAAILLKNNDADMLKFGNRAKRYKFNMLQNIFKTIADMQENEECGYGTNVASVFGELNRHYDRIFLISDMQTMDYGSFGYWGVAYEDVITASGAMNDYMRLFGRTRIYSFDLSNYHTQISNPVRGDLIMLTGLSDKVFTMLYWTEKKGKKIIEYINSIEF